MDHTVRLNVNHQFKSKRCLNICIDCLSLILNMPHQSGMALDSYLYNPLTLTLTQIKNINDRTHYAFLQDNILIDEVQVFRLWMSFEQRFPLFSTIMAK